MGWFLWKHRIKSDIHTKQTLQDVRFEKRSITAHCFLMISTGIIIVYKDDNKDQEQRAENAYNESVAKGEIVRFENRKTNRVKFYTRALGEREIPLQRVDFNCLRETITNLQQKGTYNKRSSGCLKKIWFPFIFRLLDEGVFGSQDKDMSGRAFLAYLKEEGFNPGGHSNFFEFINKLKPKSKYPRWEMTDISYKKNLTIKLNDIISFAKDFVYTYNKIKGD